VKYAFIQDRVSDVGNRYRLGAFCRMLDVSRSGYYDWIERSTQPDPDAVALEVAARAAHARGRESYGPKRLRTEMAEMGFPRSLASVKRLRARLGLRCRHKRRFVRTTDGNHTLPIAPNLLEQRFNETTAPNQVWVSDITYVHTDEGWLYVAAIKDLFNKKIVGWAMMDHMRTALVSQALWMAFKQERPAPGLIQHSDRGSQYASGEYRALLEQFGMKASMSRRGNCYDNAPMESFWASLKKEQVHHQHYATRDEARADIFDYIECFYNTIRRHSALGNQSPLDFTASLASDLKTMTI
jgi:putative transposase